MKPSPALAGRLRFTTKDVGKGFYRGNRTGSMGAHTPKGGYLIDYRKVRNYNVPDLKGFKLTPYVSREILERESPKQAYDGDEDYDELAGVQEESVARRTRALEFLREWKHGNRSQFDVYKERDRSKLEALLEKVQKGEPVELVERMKIAERMRQQPESETYIS